jgi:hypothetical protein
VFTWPKIPRSRDWPSCGAKRSDDHIQLLSESSGPLTTVLFFRCRKCGFQFSRKA